MSVGHCDEQIRAAVRFSFISPKVETGFIARRAEHRRKVGHLKALAVGETASQAT